MKRRCRSLLSKLFIFRLTIPLAFAMGFVTYIFPLLGCGPIWPEYVDDKEISCGDHGWLNLIYMNNFFSEETGVCNKAKYSFSFNQTWWSTFQCMIVTWYLANDMQFYWYAPLIIIPLWINQKIGLILLCGQLLAYTIVPIVISTYFHLPLITTMFPWDCTKLILTNQLTFYPF